VVLSFIIFVFAWLNSATKTLADAVLLAKFWTLLFKQK